MVADSTARAVATQAWSQLVLSISTNSPPSDMSRNYYYTYPEKGLDYSEKQLKRLERYKYKLGTKNIQSRMRYNMLFVQANEYENQQGIDHMRDFARSVKYSKVLQENEDDNQQGIEHIRYPLISTKHSELVQTNEDENQQDIEHIQDCLRSSKHSEVVQESESENENQQDIEHIQYFLRSSKHYAGVLINEDDNHQCIDNIEDTSSFLVNSQFLLGNEHEKQREINHILDYSRSSKSKRSELVLEDENNNQQGIEHIQDTSRLNMHFELEQAEEYGYQIEHTRDSIKSTVSFKPAEFDDPELINRFRQTARSTDLPAEAWQEPEDVYQQQVNYKEARKMSTLFDELLEVIENRDLLGEEKPTLRFQVLKVIKLLHHYGLDIIRRGVENELEDLNLNSDITEEDIAMYYKKKGLEVMLRICDTETCQRTIYDIICKAERHQVFFI